MNMDGTASRVIRVVIGLGVLSGLTGFCAVCSLPGVSACKVPVK
jgi:hypothetical protein